MRSAVMKELKEKITEKLCIQGIVYVPLLTSGYFLTRLDLVICWVLFICIAIMFLWNSLNILKLIQRYEVYKQADVIINEIVKESNNENKI